MKTYPSRYMARKNRKYDECWTVKVGDKKYQNMNTYQYSNHLKLIRGEIRNYGKNSKTN